jgi:alkylation response protein AidB-like acyl-CoA dehydrogenase
VDDTFARLCGEALQLHGGIGFTWEHDIHLFVRRAKVNQVMYGDGAWHRERLVRLVEPRVRQTVEA